VAQPSGCAIRAMDDPIHKPEYLPLTDAGFSGYDPHRAARREFLRRLRLLLLVGLAGFTLIVWSLVRVESPLERLGLVSGPRRMIRAHLAALSRGEARAAYEHFSAQYREQIPWPAYQQMIASHRDMFRTQLLEFRDRPAEAGHTVLDTELVSANGRRYVVRFTVVKDGSRWFIERVRWSQAPDPGRFSRT
jgi:hypothetical protein